MFSTEPSKVYIQWAVLFLNKSSTCSVSQRNNQTEPQKDHLTVRYWFLYFFLSAFVVLCLFSVCCLCLFASSCRRVSLQIIKDSIQI